MAAAGTKAAAGRRLKEGFFREAKRFGKLLLGIWLIATGLLPYLNINIPNQGFIMAILAIVAGILII